MDTSELLELYAAGKREFRDLCFPGAILQGAILLEADFQWTNLQEADLQKADLRGVDLQDAKLIDANLQGANLQKALLKGANLQGANLQDVNLRGANLAHAQLQEANLQGADLRGANLRRANLQGANLENVKWPPEKNLKGADLPSAVNASNRLTPQIKTRKTELLETINPTGIAEINKLAVEKERLDNKGYYTPKNIKQTEKRIITSIAQRQGQPKFRRELLEAYDYRCAITDFDAEDALEAAHIIPYCKDKDNDLSNGLLLRADIHTLFDLYLIAVHPETKKVHIAPELKSTSYRELDGEKLNLPKDENLWPRKEVLEWRYNQCVWINDSA